MARAATTDYLQNFRFHVTNLAQDGLRPLADNQAGFNSVTIPEISADMVEYREGLFKYTRKFQGVPTVSSITLSRGVALTDTMFFDWIMCGLNGGEYRTDIEIRNYARLQTTDQTQTDIWATPDRLPTTGYRAVKCYECVPTRVKAMADLDATAADVSLAEVDLELEYFEIVNVTAA